MGLGLVKSFQTLSRPKTKLKIIIDLRYCCSFARKNPNTSYNMQAGKKNLAQICYIRSVTLIFFIIQGKQQFLKIYELSDAQPLTLNKGE